MERSAARKARIAELMKDEKYARRSQRRRESYARKRDLRRELLNSMMM
jgi:hypothetical protein